MLFLLYRMESTIYAVLDFNLTFSIGIILSLLHDSKNSPESSFNELPLRNYDFLLNFYGILRCLFKDFCHSVEPVALDQFDQPLVA